MRLIDADALIDAHYEACNKDKRKMFPSWSLRLMWDAPTVDAEPVKHGKWLRDGIDKWRCSVCGTGNNYAYEESVIGIKLQDEYCPKCGARMDAEKAGDAE